LDGKDKSYLIQAPAQTARSHLFVFIAFLL
jgi:hypothetical protein